MTIKSLVEPGTGTEYTLSRRSRGFPFPLRTLAASVTLACSALVGQSVHALALGRVTVQSALGEPLRAEIDVPDINSEEAASLRAAVAQPDLFKRAGLEFNPMLSGTQISMQRRPNGRVYLLLTSDRVVNDPFLDLILEANWSAGRIVRDYTMLFDPPATRQQQQTASAPISPQAPTVPPVPAAVEPRQTNAPVPAPAVVPVAPVAAAPRAPAARVQAPAAPVAAAPKPAASPAPANQSPNNAQRVTVRPGDTATKIALASKPTKVSLDQMLIAMLRNNPDAFIAGNVNRLKSGAVLDMPGSDQFDAIPESQASEEVLAQSRDFDEFRRKLAAGIPIVATEPSKRASSGKVQAQVEDKKPGNTATDKLSLQKGTVTAKSADTKAQDKIASDLAAKEAAARLAELNKNIADLNKLATASAPAPAPAAPAPTAKPSEPVTVPSVTLPVAAASAPASPSPSPVASMPEPVASQPVVVASEPASSPAPVVVASAPVTPAPPPAVEEPGFMAELLDNPMVPAGAGGLVALLAGLAFYRSRQRKKANQADSAFMESRLQPDSFFGASGGQKVDTAEGETGHSSLAYSPSQLDAAGDVDPVAEADVYLAYGRDLQAEEILKEAVRTNPSRAAIHFKLLQIYAKRHDVKAYIAVATDAYKLSRGLGPEWAHAAEVGHTLDPTHPLFMPDGDSNSPVNQATTNSLPLDETAMDSGSGFLSTDVDLAEHAPAPASNYGPLDLDLDFSDELGTGSSPAATTSAQSTQDLQPSIDFDPISVPADLAAAPASASTLDFDSSSMGLDSLQDPVQTSELRQTAAMSLDAHLEKPETAPAAVPLEFDLGGLSLDLDPPQPSEPLAGVAPAPVPVEPVSAPAVLDSVFNDSNNPDSRGGEVSADEALATKLALAEEFQAIGDDDGARTLAQEVVDAASGNLKAKAQRFLAELG